MACVLSFRTSKRTPSRPLSGALSGATPRTPVGGARGRLRLTAQKEPSRRFAAARTGARIIGPLAGVGSMTARATGCRRSFDVPRPHDHARRAAWCSKRRALAEEKEGIGPKRGPGCAPGRAGRSPRRSRRRRAAACSLQVTLERLHEARRWLDRAELALDDAERATGSYHRDGRPSPRRRCRRPHHSGINLRIRPEGVDVRARCVEDPLDADLELVRGSDGGACRARLRPFDDLREPVEPGCGPQLTAFFRSAPILASSAAVSSFSA